MLVEPINEAQKRLVRKATRGYIERAEDIFECKFRAVPVKFDLRGRTAGMFKAVGKDQVIRYNPWIFAKYFEENLRDTVPHEVAHYIVHEVYPQRSTKPHGWQWQELMASFEADPGVTFDLDLSGIPQRRQRSHPYRCDCRLHELSTTRHNRSRRGAGEYHCRYCDGLLVYVG